MRRSEFQINDPKLFNKILRECHYGLLAMVGKDTKPYQVPLNYVLFEGKIYFHSALKGTKIEYLQKNASVSFSVVDALSLIPSYFTDITKSCSATQFFLSLSIQGEASFVEDPTLKIAVLTHMMQTMQPEGKHPSINEKQVKAMALVELELQEVTGKFKAGQNLTGEKFQGVIEALEKRGADLDKKTVFWMKELYPSNL